MNRLDRIESMAAAIAECTGGSRCKDCRAAKRELAKEMVALLPLLRAFDAADADLRREKSNDCHHGQTSTGQAIDVLANAFGRRADELLAWLRGETP